jgi:hypothetical protein
MPTVDPQDVSRAWICEQIGKLKSRNILTLVPNAQCRAGQPRSMFICYVLIPCAMYQSVFLFQQAILVSTSRLGCHVTKSASQTQ